jgi:transposase
MPPLLSQNKDKVERFNDYLKNSFITPLPTTLKHAGPALDIDTVNSQVDQWLD